MGAANGGAGKIAGGCRATNRTEGVRVSDKKLDVVALGELLIDFTDVGFSAAGQRLFEQNPGGAPANVLCALARLGLRTAFMGKVGADMHGEYLRRVLQEEGVGTEGLVTTDKAFTTLAFVALEAGERVFSFARKPGADTQLAPADIDPAALADARVFHFGSLSLTDEPARSATLEAAAQAKAAGAVISYDPNYRAPLWPSEQAAAEMMRKPLPLVDVIKISDAETELLTGLASPEDAARHLAAQGAKLVAVTLGRDGVLLCTGGLCCTVPGFSVEAVDTTGAGDSFWGGFLYQLCARGCSLDGLTEPELREMATFANAVAALCVTRRGAIPALPTLAEVNEFLDNFT